MLALSGLFVALFCPVFRSSPCGLRAQIDSKDQQKIKTSGFLGFWDFGILGFWDFGILGFWDFGILGFWDFD